MRIDNRVDGDTPGQHLFTTNYVRTGHRPEIPSISWPVKGERHDKNESPVRGTVKLGAKTEPSSTDFELHRGRIINAFVQPSKYNF